MKVRRNEWTVLSHSEDSDPALTRHPRCVSAELHQLDGFVYHGRDQFIPSVLTLKTAKPVVGFVFASLPCSGSSLSSTTTSTTTPRRSPLCLLTVFEDGTLLVWHWITQATQGQTPHEPGQLYVWRAVGRGSLPGPEGELSGVCDNLGLFSSYIFRCRFRRQLLSPHRVHSVLASLPLPSVLFTLL